MPQGLLVITAFSVNLFLGFASAVILSSALISQYVFGLEPCILCLWQRWPYGIVIVLSLLGILLRNHPLVLRSIVGICGVVLLVGATIAIYHVGVEHGLFDGPGCSGEMPKGAALEELREAVMSAPAVRCDEPAIIIAGLSMAGWNAVLGALLGATAIFIAGRKRQYVVE